MSNNVHISIASWNLALNAALDTPLANGKIELYDGAQPATPDVAVSTQHLLATLTFGATAFGAAASGVKTANAIASGTVTTSGTAAWARLYKSDGTTAVVDCTVGTSGADLNLSAVALTSGGSVAVSSLTISMPAAQ